MQFSTSLGAFVAVADRLRWVRRRDYRSADGHGP